MKKGITALDVLNCAKNPPIKLGDAILPAWVRQKLNVDPKPLLKWCVELGYLEIRDHSKDPIPSGISYNITHEGYMLLTHR